MYRKLAVVSIIVLVLSLAFASVSFAQSGTGTSNNSSNNNNSNSNNNSSQGTGPGNAFNSLGAGGSRSLRADQQQWYAFQYAGDNSPIQIELSGSNVQFSVWTQQDIADSGGDFGASANPVARSTPNDQFSGHQFWLGSFNTPGTYYIMVENANGGQGGNYTLQVTGTGVSWKGQSGANSSNNNASASNANSGSTNNTSGSTSNTSGSTNNTSGSTSNTSGSTSNTSGSTAQSGTAPRTLPRTGGEFASVLPMLLGAMGALSVTAGALLRRKK